VLDRDEKNTGAFSEISSHQMLRLFESELILCAGYFRLKFNQSR